MSSDGRYCDKLDMTPQQFNNYKASKYTRLIWYIIGMVFSSLFIEAIVGYVFITGWLIASYWLDAKNEEQWIKDGSITKDDLKPK